MWVALLKKNPNPVCSSLIAFDERSVMVRDYVLNGKTGL